MSEADTNAPQPASQKEPPVEGPEVHHPHKHHSGGLPRWLELSIAFTALITSVSSIVIAIHHGKTMEKLVQANSLPYMAAGVSDVTPEGAQILSLDILNRGVGPAHEKSLRVKVDGQYVASVDALIAASLTPAEVAEVQKARDDRVLVITKNNVKHRFVPGGAEQMIFRTTGRRRTRGSGICWMTRRRNGRSSSAIARCSTNAGTSPASGRSRSP
jgi:hypothetical protein